MLVTVSYVMAQTGDTGADVVFEVSGSSAGATVMKAMVGLSRTTSSAVRALVRSSFLPAIENLLQGPDHPE